MRYGPAAALTLTRIMSGFFMLGGFLLTEVVPCNSSARDRENPDGTRFPLRFRNCVLIPTSGSPAPSAMPHWQPLFAMHTWRYARRCSKEVVQGLPLRL